MLKLIGYVFMVIGVFFTIWIAYFLLSLASTLGNIAGLLIPVFLIYGVVYWIKSSTNAKNKNNAN